MIDENFSDIKEFEYLLDRLKHFEKLIFATFSLYFAALAYLFNDKLSDLHAILLSTIILGSLSLLHTHVSIVGASYAITILNKEMALKTNQNCNLSILSVVWNRFGGRLNRTYSLITFIPSGITIITILFISYIKLNAYQIFLGSILALIYTAIFAYFLWDSINKVQKAFSGLSKTAK